jgi:hypothetical protein
MKTFFSLFLCLLFTISTSQAQDIDDLKPSQYFDFWVSEWSLTFKEKNGTFARAKNSITKIMSGKVIEENFEVLSGQIKGYTGKSWTVYNPETQKWKQTWVDNQGAYLTFDGKIEGDKRIFFRETTDSDNKNIIQRMVFYDITDSSFIWDWQQSSDDGNNWQLLWRINYERRL